MGCVIGCGPCAMCNTMTATPEGEWAEGWFRLEDEAVVAPLCSVACAVRYLSTGLPAAREAGCADADPLRADGENT